MKYAVYTLPQSRSAKNKVMVWSSLNYLNPNFRHLAKLFEFEAPSDQQAQTILIEKVNAVYPGDLRGIAGLSYLRNCRPALRKTKG